MPERHSIYFVVIKSYANVHFKIPFLHMKIDGYQQVAGNPQRCNDKIDRNVIRHFHKNVTSTCIYCIRPLPIAHNRCSTELCARANTSEIKILIAPVSFR